MRKVAVAVMLGLLLAVPALADAPATSPRPEPRPAHLMQPGATDAVVVEVARPAAARPAVANVRPKPRPAFILAEPARAPQTQPEVQSTPAPVVAAAAPARRGLFGFLRPAARPEGMATAAAVRTKPGKDLVVSKKGSVCGVAAIKGETLAPITARVQGCGIKEPVRITSVNGVRLSTAATVDCDTARALNTWVERGVQPAFGRDKVVELKVAAHYICRARNNVKGAKISEHGRGKAIDISGFVLSNGKTVTVSKNYDKTMRKAYKAACGIFGTTLGPGSDGHHEDHLHFDTADNRGRAYCR